MWGEGERLICGENLCWGLLGERLFTDKMKILKYMGNISEIQLSKIYIMSFSSQKIFRKSKNQHPLGKVRRERHDFKVAWRSIFANQLFW